MTGDLAVSSRPAVAERPASEAARQRPTATTKPAAQPAPAGTRGVHGPAEQSAAQPDPARLKARLADPAVRVRAHRDDATARLVLQVVDRTTGRHSVSADELLEIKVKAAKLFAGIEGASLLGGGAAAAPAPAAPAKKSAPRKPRG